MDVGRPCRVLELAGLQESVPIQLERIESGINQGASDMERASED